MDLGADKRVYYRSGSVAQTASQWRHTRSVG